MKKFTTLLLAILLVLPAMAATFNSGDVIYLNANIWETGGAKFSAAFDDSVFADEFGEKTSEGYYKFTVPGSDNTYNNVRFVRNTNVATQPGLDKWNETIQYAAEDGKDLFTVNAWDNGEGGRSTGSWSTYVPQTPETLTYNVTVPVGTPACYIAGEMNGWSFTAMTKVDDTHYTITYDNVMKSTQYKYTCGDSWDYEEVIGANRTYTANDVVTAWRALPTEPKETLTYNVTVPEGTPACYIAGGMNGWSFTAMTKVDDTHYTITYDNVTRSTQYKYTCGDSWDYVEVIGGNRTYNENDEVTAWTKVIYNENITCNNSYLLNVANAKGDDNVTTWFTANPTFAAWFYNKNMTENNAVLVQGAELQENVILFYLDENHVKDNLNVDEAIKFTHVVFLRLNPEVEYTFANAWPGDENVWNRVETYCPGSNMYFQLTGMEAGTWKVLDPNATGVNRVELAEGIGYAYGVVSAEGAIEVYNVNGAVVARGNDNVDLRGLGRGVYIIRNGNQVRKVVR